MNTHAQARKELLRAKVVDFCAAFVEQRQPTQLLDDFFVSRSHKLSTTDATPNASGSGSGSGPMITEHGPAWAAARLPFLGQTFRGRRPDGDSDAGSDGDRTSASTNPPRTCDDYFRLLQHTLALLPTEEPGFPAPEHFAVDVDADAETVPTSGGVVTVVARGKFQSKRTGIQWTERSSHRFSAFDDQGRIGHWEIWADPLSAWMAEGGEDGTMRDEKK
ncbi:MAG: hypothetical protein M1826_004419 [Phylliscum demangeonii]|nr:MAG: hypothetical protein M1826_004419 [Phylliscum demangeonii]